MHTLQTLTAQLRAGSDLSYDEAESAAQFLALAELDRDDKKNFLLALSNKGETVHEVTAFAQTFRNYAIDAGVEAWADQAIDVCGTGGDGSGTFNISTAVSFVVAAAGVPVFKHGNRSITSSCGSADLLESLGIALEAPHDVLRDSLKELNFCFFFAPAFHPVFKQIVPVRQLLAAEGKRSIFNLLGPLINPGRPAHQLLGVYAPEWVNPLADALDALGLKAGWVAHGLPEQGAALDELSCAGSNLMAGFGRLKSERGELLSTQVGLKPCRLFDLKGGGVQGNRQLMLRLLAGDSDGIIAGLKDSVLLNAGVALYIAGRVDCLVDGIAAARELLDSGRVAQWLSRVQEFYKGVNIR
jgi:anthranilate phosphoribosyltransferase